MAVPQLRPLSIGEILDAAIKVVLKHWKPLALAVILPILPLMVLTELLAASMDTDSLTAFERSGDPADIPSEFWVSGGLSILVTMVMSVLVNAVCFKAVADAWLGAEPSVGRSWRFALPRVLPLLFMLFVTFVAYALGGLTLFIVSVWLYVMWSVSTATLLFERVGPFKALGRSFELIKGRFWATLLLSIAVTLLVAFVAALLQGIPAALVAIFAADNEIAIAISNVVSGTVANAFLLPISAACFTILYFDQRVRKEGFDIQLLSQGIGTEFDPDAPIPAPLQPVEGVYDTPRLTWGTPEQQWAPPPPRQEYGGWSAPSAQDEPSDRSPWMDAPDTPGRWAPPEEAEPEDAERWRNPARAEQAREDDSEWPPRDQPRGPGGL